MNVATNHEKFLATLTIGNTASNVTDLRFEPPASYNREECVTAQPDGRYKAEILEVIFIRSSQHALGVLIKR